MFQAERRGSERHLTVLRVAALHVDGTTQLCMVRNVSPGGLRLRVFRPPSVGARLLIELKSGHFLGGRATWSRGSDLGAALDAPLDVYDLLSTSWNGARDRRPRLPRMEIDRTILVRLDARRRAARLCDISQGGAKLEICGGAALGSSALLQLAEAASVAGTVRWTAGDAIGIAFNEQLSLRWLSDWLWHQSVGGEAMTGPSPLRPVGFRR
jgi:hypothetical protein